MGEDINESTCDHSSSSAAGSSSDIASLRLIGLQGSFPDELLRTTLMREIYAAARLFYFAFQQHSVPYGEEPELLAENDPERARRLTNGFGVKGCSFVRMLGPDVALVRCGLLLHRHRTTVFAMARAVPAIGFAI